MSTFTHINKDGQPSMVDVGDKQISKRTATAHGRMFLGREIISLLRANDMQTKKGPVFQTAIVAGIQAVKRTSELIPMCHPLAIQKADISIDILDEEAVEIRCEVAVEGKTGVEMEALTGVNIAALTVYDMCKSVSQEMRIEEIRLIRKTGGKSDIDNE